MLENMRPYRLPEDHTAVAGEAMSNVITSMYTDALVARQLHALAAPLLPIRIGSDESLLSCRGRASDGEQEPRQATKLIPSRATRQKHLRDASEGEPAAVEGALRALWYAAEDVGALVVAEDEAGGG